jgi:broad specificity polyphosphatase/5'/3'-nucleotidase SurE
MSKPLILICNDDGIHAPGIRALVEAVKDLGDLVVVAGVGCKSAKPWQPPEIAALADERSLAVPGAFYKLKGGVNGFFYDVPKFTDVLPEKVVWANCDCV